MTSTKTKSRVGTHAIARVTAAAETVAVVRRRLDAISAEYEAVKDDFKAAARAAGIPTVETEAGDKVTFYEGTTRSFNLAVLAERISKVLFRQVTKPAIDLEKFDAAVTLGKVPAEVVAEVVDSKPTDGVRVTLAPSK